MADAATKRCKTVPDELVIVRPDDMHLHLRDGDMMRTVAPLSAAWVRGTRPVRAAARGTVHSAKPAGSNVGNSCLRLKARSLCSGQAGRALIMPNLKPPVTTTELALAYRSEPARPQRPARAASAPLRALTPLAATPPASERILDAVKAKCPDSKYVPLPQRAVPGHSVSAVKCQCIPDICAQRRTTPLPQIPAAHVALPH